MDALERRSSPGELICCSGELVEPGACFGAVGGWCVTGASGVTGLGSRCRGVRGGVDRVTGLGSRCRSMRAAVELVLGCVGEVLELGR